MQSQFQSPHRIVLIAVLLGLLAERLFLDRWLGLSLPIFIGAGLAALTWISKHEERPANKASHWLAIAALFFASLIAVYDTEALTVLNFFAMIGLLILYVTTYRTQPLWRFNGLDIVTKPIVSALSILATPIFVGNAGLRAIPFQRSHFQTAIPVARGIALAVPVLLCFGVLLVSADQVFASYVDRAFNFSLPFDLDTVVGHTIFAGIIGWGCMGGIAVALSPTTIGGDLPAEGDTQQLKSIVSLRFLGWIEVTIVLIAVNLLFSAFMLVQAGYLFGGLDTLQQTQMTYSDYARRGFFELVTVACLSLAMLWVIAMITKRETHTHANWFNALCTLMVALVTGMLVSAFYRMWLYEEAYGFTELRLYTHSFMVYLGVVLVLFVVSLFRNQMMLFIIGSGVAAIIGLGTVNLINPQAIIVRANVSRDLQPEASISTGSSDRYTESTEFDAHYLTQLSADAIPTMIEVLPLLGPEEQTIINQHLRDEYARLKAASDEQGLAAWNLMRWQALQAIEQQGLSN